MKDLIINLLATVLFITIALICLPLVLIVGLYNGSIVYIKKVYKAIKAYWEK